MNANITKPDVIKYFANQLDRARRRELESACQSDEQVRQWFDELTPTEEQIDQIPLPKVQIDPARYRSHAALAYLSVEMEDRVQQWRNLLGELQAGTAEVGTLANLIPAETLEVANGTLVYRGVVPPETTLAADNETISDLPEQIPCIYPDLKKGSLLIRQKLEEVPNGEVDVIIVRLRDGRAAALPPVRVSLECFQPRVGKPYWYADIPLAKFADDFQAGDDLFYGVEAATKPESTPEHS